MLVFCNPFQPNVCGLSSKKYQNETMEEFPGKGNMQGPGNDIGQGKLELIKWNNCQQEIFVIVGVYFIFNVSDTGFSQS